MCMIKINVFATDNGDQLIGLLLCGGSNLGLVLCECC